ncbi:MAG: endonuclease domain-containing protein [Candidatus Moraniibacteriota bacterium]|jgi:very-short-patch-repair endonuclease
MKSKNTNKARNLRKKQTPQETMMWARLRNRRFLDLKFRRQYPIGDYIVDFVCFDKKLIVEIDGWQHKEEFCGKKDDERTKYLELQGYYVVRFWNNDVNNNIDSIFLKLEEIVKNV